MNPRSILLVSSDLSLAGGGKAVAGRLFREALSAYCRTRGGELRTLHLGHPEALLSHADIVHYRGSKLQFAAATLLALREAPDLVVYDHVNVSRLQTLLPWRREFLIVLYGIDVWRRLPVSARLALRRARSLITISKHTRDKAAAIHATVGRAEVLPLALENRLTSGSVDRDLLDASGEDYILMVGRMSSAERYKGHEHLLRAFAEVSASSPDSRLVVVGGGDDRHRLALLAERLGLGRRALFPGFVSEATLSELYDRCCFFALPSRDEGFGLVYLEAMRAGKACVACVGGAAEELVGDGESGLLVGYGDEAGLATAIRTLLQDGALRARMGDRGRDRFAAGFTYELFEKRLHRLIDQGGGDR